MDHHQKNIEPETISAAGFSSFASLVNQIGITTKTNDKLNLLIEYLAKADSDDKVWLIALFSGRQPRRIASGSLLRNWCREITDLPAWLIDESYGTVGDLAETIALLLPDHENTHSPFFPYVVC